MSDTLASPAFTPEGIERRPLHVFSEKAYILTSLVAKSALAWQVFGSTLAT